MHSRPLLFAKVMRWLALCVLALGALGVHARAMPNAPLEKLAVESTACTLAQGAQVLDASEENTLNYGARMSGPTIYVYAHSDPAHGLDPRGRVTMTEMAIGGASLAVLAAIALPNPLDLITGGAPGRSGLWQALTAMEISHNVPDEAYDKMIAAQVKAMEKTHKGDEGHHTIPKYLCGHENQVPLVDLSYSQHAILHAGLSAVTLAIEVIGNRKQDFLNVTLGRRKLSVVQELGTTAAGRGAIANAIWSLYSAAGAELWRSPTAPIGGETVMSAFNKVRQPFEAGFTSCMP